MTHSSLPATVVSAQKMPHAQKDDILAYAREIFGDPQKTHSWLTTPNPVFRGMRPKDLIVRTYRSRRFLTTNERLPNLATSVD